MTTTTLETIRALDHKLTDLIRAVHQQHLEDEPKKDEPKRYSMKETAALIGRSYRAIRSAEIDGGLPNPVKDGQARRSGYSLAEINHARDHFGTRLRRVPDDPIVILAFANFKGGSGKTTSAVHFAQYAAQAGLRVLLVDVDPQASSTAMFGYIPDDDIDADGTIQTYLEGESDDLSRVVRPTYWDGLDLIPANLELYNAEYIMASDPSRTMLQRLKTGLESLAHDYDVVVIDPPPALGMISLSVMHAASALVIPSPAAVSDLFSTKAFAAMLRQVVESLQKFGYPIDYHFIRLMITRLDENSETQAQLVDVLPDVLGTSMLSHCVRKTAALDRATAKGRTIYEVSARDVSPKVLKRGVMYFDRVNEEIVQLIRRSWPSHHKALHDAGHDTEI